MSVAAAVCAAVALLMSRTRRARLRLAVAAAAPRKPRQDWLTRPSTTVGRAGLAVLAAGTLLALLGPAMVVGSAVVVAAALALRWVRTGRRAHVDIDAALCIDLLAAAMACGAMPAAALRATASGLRGVAGEALAEAATALSLGANPDLVWRRVATAVPPLRGAARACARAASSGAAVADELFRLAASARADAQVDRRRRLQRAGVWLVLPLGVCFLPAFVLVAVVPVVLAAVPALAQ
jgi:Type II secretion system (T2SS), protein F